MSDPVRTVTNAERRARLGARHALADPVPDVLSAAHAVVCLHATEPSSLHLSAWARSGTSRDDVDAALYTERSLIKQLAMRRTVFAVPVDLLPAVRGSAAARVAGQQSALLARTVVAGGLAADEAGGAAWVERACEQVLEQLRRAPATTRQLRELLPVLAERLPRPEARKAPPAPVAARLLTVLAARGAVVRGMNQGGWTTSRPVWTLLSDWLAEPMPPLTQTEGYADLVRRWLWAFGPGTEGDIAWWSGAPRTSIRRALADVGAIPVQLEDGAPAWLHPDDVGEVRAPGHWTALLPPLDPTTMGWRERGFYVDPDTALAVYDSAGNGRPTAWWDGRIVGSWAQRQDAAVVVHPLTNLPGRVAAALRHQAGELTRRLDGHVLRSSLQQPLD
jgi:Winged helix DNA-binding domain